MLRELDMRSDIKEILDQAQTEIGRCGSLEELQEIEGRYLGRKGSVTALLKAIKDVPAEERKTFGQDVNQVRIALEAAAAERRAAFVAAAAEAAAQFDVTLPGIAPERGTLNPVTRTMYDLNDAFLSLGFEIFDEPDISSEAYVFDYLNIPQDHPARESMDTYWLADSQGKKALERLCLRPQLTGASVRYMQQHKPPFRFVYPGRVYRNESTDAGHERAFFQYEALIVDRCVPFSAGRLLVNTILERVFGRKIKTRMRAGFFPFVEPGFEIDMQCQVCAGKGCSVCKQSGWIELMPGGPPHPHVFRAGGIDPTQWQGFYIDIGLDRLAMMRHGIDDVRLLRSADLRFLRQFV